MYMCLCVSPFVCGGVCVCAFMHEYVSMCRQTSEEMVEKGPLGAGGGWPAMSGQRVRLDQQKWNTRTVRELGDMGHGGYGGYGGRVVGYAVLDIFI